VVLMFLSLVGCHGISVQIVFVSSIILALLLLICLPSWYFVNKNV